MTARLLWAPAPFRAGFCITDDTDAATLPTVRAVYETLLGLGLTATKTVWAFAPDESCGIPATPDSTLRGVTLEDPDYLAYCRSLAERGVEVVLHGASAGNNRRDRTEAALALADREFGTSGTWICHSKNADNIYWEQTVAPNAALRRLLALYSRHTCTGEVPESPYFWGDLCRQRIRQIRLFRTRDTNTLAADPAMPYHEAGKPFVRGWFSASKRSFADCTAPSALDRLAADGGLTVLYQYLHRYGRADGSVDPGFRADAERLAADPRIWTAPTAAVMDRLRQMQGVVLAHRGRELRLANVRDVAVGGVQLQLPPGVAADGETPADGVLAVGTLAAGEVRRVSLSRRVRVTGRTAARMPSDGRLQLRLGLATSLVNASPDPWHAAGIAVPPGRATLVPDAGWEDPPLSVPGQAYRSRLFFGQLAIIAREIALRKRSIDTDAFLGADVIPLEDHANW